MFGSEKAVEKVQGGTTANMADKVDFKKGKYYMIFLVVLLVLFAASNMVGMRYFGSQSEKWSPESQGQSHK